MSENTDDLLPILPSRTTVLFPGRRAPLKVRRKGTKSILESAKRHQSQLVFLAESQKNAELLSERYYGVGTLAIVHKKKGGEYSLEGVRRVKVLEIIEDSGVMKARSEPLEDLYDVAGEGLELLTKEMKRLGQRILDLIPADTKSFKSQVESFEDPSLLSYLISENLETTLIERQQILEEVSVKKRSLLVLEKMQAARESLALQAQIRSKLAEKMTKSQKEGILREHLRAIQDELGEGENQNKLRKKLEELSLPEKVKEQVEEELAKLEAMGRHSPESHMIRTYLELIAALPWQRQEQPSIDLKKAQEILDRDHFGLSKVKKRVIEHLAVLKLSGKIGSTILLFVGPPGVGKTSLGRSIASCLGRSFVRVSLGGVRDDAEIRGHRRTYIGALPGQIIQGIKRAGASNPVFLLDEIDKLGKGFSGDPASALLEVLDPDINNGFVDHYLDLPYDLSDVLFICTANSMADIPDALRDRLEIIELSSYTSEEKRHIAKNHLIPKELEAHGVKKEQFELKDSALSEVILKYTREAGVRDLKRRLAALLRSAARDIVEGAEKVTLVEGDLEPILGREVHDPEDSAKELPFGVVTGLAWTPVGGDILFVEARLMPGSGKLTLTGKLGDVMKESAQIALSLIRSKFPKIMPGFKDEDLHIHVPSGSIPKDGPSAGIALFTAIASLLTEKAISPQIAMTGEITLRGVVMPVGGVKEKLLAANRAGIKVIILCKKNMKDLKDVPKSVLDELRIIPVEDVIEVLDATLGLSDGDGQLKAPDYAGLN